MKRLLRPFEILSSPAISHCCYIFLLLRHFPSALPPFFRRSLVSSLPSLSRKFHCVFSPSRTPGLSLQLYIHLPLKHRR